MLASTSASFLVSRSPINSASELPTFTLPPAVPLAPDDDLLCIEPETENERRLLERLHEQTARAKQDQKERSDERAIIVLQAEYCASVRNQLASQEEKASKGKGKARLVGDGLPRLLTGDVFFERVVQHEADAKAGKLEKDKMQSARNAYAEALEKWKHTEDQRKAQNKATTAAWREAVVVWEKERDLAKTEGRRAAWKKPIRGKLMAAVPKPKVPKAGDKGRVLAVDTVSATESSSDALEGEETESDAGLEEDDQI
ncbi:hypothetical protein FA95DRAFT_1550697 [Auriscalpium vulgare]|uniref:Uncharacterized protein n=1 Tax=Auriscalpium vulgare TaxID=40419 RepID=A0ACB8R729_9AGAM|nr:hypothetical protein FA95DRAFT_1550697 [Auriscalpium vulgare]